MRYILFALILFILNSCVNQLTSQPDTKDNNPPATQTPSFDSAKPTEAPLSDPTNTPAVVGEKSCTQDSDCIKTVKGCCPCRSGGREIAINKQFTPTPQDCQNVMCPTSYLCTARVAKCVELECALQ